MIVMNQHSRRLGAPVDAAGTFLETLASRKDGLWPHERWPRMRLDGPLADGASGGHGPIRYYVESHEPGRSVSFRFSTPKGSEGTHRFVVEGSSEGCELRHVVDVRVSGRARFSWPLLFRPLHDALLEDTLDKAEAALSGKAWEPRRLSRGVRILRRLAARGRKRRSRASE